MRLEQGAALPGLPGGASISFHVMRRGGEGGAVGFNAGGNIVAESLVAATAPHGHQYPELLVLLCGELVHRVNGETQALAGGDIVFVRPGDVHSFELCGDGQCELVSFLFELEILADLGGFLKDGLPLRAFTAPVAPPALRLDVQETEGVALRMLTISSQQVVAIAAARTKIRSLVAELFLRRFVEDGEEIERPAVPAWLDELCRVMRQGDNPRKGLAVLRKLAPCSPEHLCLCFRKHFNKTPTDFVNELRLAQAARRLIDTDDKLFSVATESGYLSLSRFHSLFKRHFGVSPARYRSLRRNCGT